MTFLNLSNSEVLLCSEALKNNTAKVEILPIANSTESELVINCLSVDSSDSIETHMASLEYLRCYEPPKNSSSNNEFDWQKSKRN